MPDATKDPEVVFPAINSRINGLKVSLVERKSRTGGQYEPDGQYGFLQIGLQYPCGKPGGRMMMEGTQTKSSIQINLICWPTWAPPV